MLFCCDPKRLFRKSRLKRKSPERAKKDEQQSLDALVKLSVTVAAAQVLPRKSLQAPRRDSAPGQSREPPQTLQQNPPAVGSLDPPEKGHGLWLLAEEKLRMDEKASKLLAVAVEVLRDFQFESQANGIDARPQLCNFLENQTRDLEDKKWLVKLSDHGIEKDRLTKIFKTILLVKDVVNAAISVSPPAAIVYAGVMVGLQCAVRAFEQQAILLEGLETISALIPRLNFLEEHYFHPDTKRHTDLPPDFRNVMISLCSRILEYQATALCYQRKNVVSQSLRSAFLKDDWDRLIKGIKKDESSVNNFRHVIESTESRARFAALEKKLSALEVWKVSAGRDEKVEYLFKLLYTCHYKDSKDRNKQRLPDTCNWFTRHPRFQAWIQNDHSSLLWVSADPGCGKSVLAKYLIDDVLPSPQKTICYFFFKDDSVAQKTATNALAAILRQLFMAQPHLLPDSVLKKMSTDGEKLVGSFMDLWNVFIDVITTPETKEVICVFDALDECQDDTRHSLIDCLQRFYLRSDIERFNVKFLVTSRPYDYIRRGFHTLEQEIPTIHLSGEDEAEVEAISKEIDLVINERVKEIGEKISLSQGKRDYLQEKLSSIPNRTYLWVSLTLDVFQRMSGFTKGDIKDIIDKLPHTVDEAYEKILNGSPDQDKARRLLRIVTAAEEPLSLQALSLAYAFSIGKPGPKSSEEIDERVETDEIMFQRTIRELCGHLLVVVDSRVYLLHQTVKEFLAESTHSASNSQQPTAAVPSTGWRYSLKPEVSHEVLARSCMSFLATQKADISSSSPLPPPPPPLPSLKGAGPPPKLLASNFLMYAGKYWASHFRSVCIRSDELIKLAWNLCQPDSHGYKNWTRYFIQYNKTKIKPPLSNAAFLGLKPIVEKLLDSEQQGSYWRPAFLAVGQGHEEVVKLLLNTGRVDMANRGSEGTTALLVASRNGYERIAELLINTSKAVLNTPNDDGDNPLSSATSGGHEGIVRLLLNIGKADVNFQNSNGLTPLMLAFLGKHEGVMKLLLDTQSVDVNLKDRQGWNPLLKAAYEGRVSFVKLLLGDKNVDVNIRNSAGKTPLSLASSEGHEEVVRLLLDVPGVDVNCKTALGMTPLIFAASRGYSEVVTLLLDAEGIDAGSSDVDGRTALLFAEERGREAVVKLLKDRNVCVRAEVSTPTLNLEDPH